MSSFRLFSSPPYLSVLTASSQQQVPLFSPRRPALGYRPLVRFRSSDTVPAIAPGATLLPAPLVQTAEDLPSSTAQEVPLNYGAPRRVNNLAPTAPGIQQLRSLLTVRSPTWTLQIGCGTMAEHTPDQTPETPAATTAAPAAASTAEIEESTASPRAPTEETPENPQIEPDVVVRRHSCHKRCARENIADIDIDGRQ